MSMIRLRQILLFFPIIMNINSCEYRHNYMNLLNGVVTMFKNMSVHTVWSNTCWNTSVNIELLTRLSYEDISITFDLRKMSKVYQTHSTWYKSGIIVDLACNQSSNVLQQASNERLFNLQNVWILFNEHRYPNRTDTVESALQTFKTHMSQIYVLPDSIVYLLIRIDNELWEIWDGFRFSVSEGVRVSKVGMISPDRVDFRHSDRTNFQRVVLKAATVILEPTSFLGWNEPIKTFNLDLFAHLHYAVSVILAAQLNFTLNLTFSSDYGWNYGNGTYSGLTGELQREEIDFTAAGGLMRTDRMDVGDPTIGTFVARTIAIFKQPPLSSVNNIFTLPFAYDVWIMTFCMVFVFIVALIFLTWTSNKLKGEKTQFATALDTVTLVVGAVCQQGLSIASLHSTAARLATFILFLTAVFLSTSYAANIVVLLQSTSQAIKNLNDLADKPITFSVQDTRHNYIYFNETVNENIKKIYLNKIKVQGKRGFTSAEVGLERVRNEFHAHLVEITMAYHIIAKTWQENEKCSLSEKELYKIPLLTIYVIKKSGYKDLFKQKMIQQHEVGLRYQIFKRIMPQKQKCDSARSAVINFDSVSFKEIYPALLFLGYGIFVSFLIFLCERILITLVNNRKINQN